MKKKKLKELKWKIVQLEVTQGYLLKTVRLMDERIRELEARK